MKKTITMAALAVAVSFTAIACKKKVSDADLTAQATTLVQSNPNASVTVEKGHAHLSGTFASEADRDAMIASLKGIKGIESVHDMTTITAPVAAVEVNAVSPEVLQKVQDALKDFPSVKAEVVNGELTLSGNVSSTQARKIKESIDALNIGKYTNNVVVK